MFITLAEYNINKINCLAVKSSNFLYNKKTNLIFDTDNSSSPLFNDFPKVPQRERPTAKNTLNFAAGRGCKTKVYLRYTC